jgi:hypothetical protein
MVDPEWKKQTAKSQQQSRQLVTFTELSKATGSLWLLAR